MSLTETANKHSERFEPAFAQLNVPAGEGKTHHAPLDVTFQHGGRLATPLPVQGEQPVARYAVVASAVGLMNAQGEPPEVAGSDKYAPVQLAYGAGELLVTDRRLVLLLTRAETIVGDINVMRGKVFVATMDFDHVHSVALEQKSGLLGRVKCKRSVVSCLAHVAALAVTDTIGPVDGARATPTDNALLTLNDLVVDAAARSRLRSAQSDHERELLRRALNGERVRDENELVAQLVP